MKQLDVAVGGIVVSTDAAATVKTYALGSCVALVAWDHAGRVAGMLHAALPDSTGHDEKARVMPGYFVDTGVRELIGALRSAGARRNTTSFQLIGGANVIDAASSFDVGERNVLAVKRILWTAGLGVIREDTGGRVGRTVSLSVATGQVVVSTHQPQRKEAMNR